MVNTAEITLTDLIHDGRKSSIYKAVAEFDHLPVIVKILKDEYTSSHKDIANLKHEYTILKKLKSSHVIETLGLERIDNRWMLIEEFIEGESLQSLIKRKDLDLKTFLKIAIGLAEGLGEIHNQYVIHKDIKPQNILINESLSTIKFIDFGISTILSREIQEVFNPELLEGSLSYISPEQTGRMNKPLDYRTDIYSLGITLYEMLTGQLPFISNDPMQLIFMHIAKPVTPPYLIKQSIPRVLSDIICKCLEKDPEERYNSGYGLKNDLDKCLFMLQKNGLLEAFVPGENDVYDRFQIPQKLYGREMELKILNHELDRVSEGTKIVLVSGYSGIGKSSVVQEMKKKIVEKKGYFVSGKFDQYNKDIPFSAFIQSFQNLIQQLLSESDKRLAMWRDKLQTALGLNGQLIIDLIPELELIIGKQPAVPKSDLEEAENRLLHVLFRFIKVFLEEECPLAIFLDDMQWADFSSLKLFRSLATNQQINNLIIIAAYRNNEVDANHPFSIMVQGIKQEGVSCESLEIGPLALNSIDQLVNETLHTTFEKSLPLAILIFKKTQGNPFFVHRFLRSLYHLGLITFDLKSQSWVSDLASIEALEVTENVADLIGKTIQNLSSQTQEALKLASVIGNTFDLRMLTSLLGQTRAQVAEYIWEALNADCIFALQASYSLDLLKVSDDDEQEEFKTYKFQHDHLQQVAYAMIPEEKKDELHTKIGKFLLNFYSPKEQEDNIIEIVNHLNHGINFLQTPKEKLELVILNEKAGKKAISSIAYPAAERYLATCISLLPQDAWDTSYALTFSLHQQLLVAYHLAGKTKEVISLVDDLISKAHSPEEKAALYLFKMEPILNMFGFRDSVECGKEGLKQLGIKNLDITKGKIIFEILKLKVRFSFFDWNTLKDIPIATDPRIILIAKLYSRIASIAVYLNTHEFAAVVINVMKMSLKYGQTPSFPAALIGFALSMVTPPFLQFKKAYHLGSIAFGLFQKNLEDRASYFFGLQFLSRLARFGEPYGTLVPKVQQYAQQGLANGHLWIATGPVNLVLAWLSFTKGDNLNDTQKTCESGIISQYNVKMTSAVYALMTLRQFIRLLTCEASEYQDASLYEWGPYPETFKEIYEQQHSAPTFVFGDLIFKVIHYHYLGDHENAVIAYEKLIKENTGLFPNDLRWSCVFLHAGRSLSQVLNIKYSKKRFKELKYIDKYFKKCAECSPENYSQHSFITSAEILFINNREQEAVKLCQEAIKLARKNNDLCCEAMGYELLGQFFQDDLHIQKAYSLYQTWGAKLKLKELEIRYPEACMEFVQQAKELIYDQGSSTTTSIPTTSSTTSATSKDGLALYTIMKSAQVLTEEINLDKLVTKLMRLVIMEAGADKALLILAEGNNMTVKAEIKQNQENATIFNNTALEDKYDEICLSIVAYVSRSHKEVLLKDATREGQFTQDFYILKYKPLSILCLPLIYQGKVTGVLYLENSLVSGAFTPQRSNMLSLLSSQIAISIENATFYSILEDKVTARTKELTKTLDELKTTQDHLVESEKLAALGQLIAGIAHEINNPIGAVKSSASNSVEALDYILKQLSEFISMMDSSKALAFLEIIKMANSVKQFLSTAEERKLKKHFRQRYEELNISDAEDVAATLVDMGIYQDVSPILVPLGDQALHILNFAYNIVSLYKNNGNILNAVNNAAKIVFALKSFVQQGHSEDLTEYNICEGVDTILSLYQHKFKDKIEIIKNYQAKPKVMCRRDDLNQVWTNLIHNAMQAIKEQGTIQIDVIQEDSQVIVKVTDSGEGIPEEIKPRIFSPFFTTKAAGEGSGLGLNISKKIIESYQGTLNFTSVPQKTMFTVKIPTKNKSI